MDLLPIYSIPLWQTSYTEFPKNANLIEDAIERIRIKKLKTLDQYFINVNIGFLTSFMIQSSYYCSSDLNLNTTNFIISNVSFYENDIKFENMGKDSTFTSILWTEYNKDSFIKVDNHPFEWQGFSFVDNIKNQYTSKEVSVNPEVGDVFIFPSYLNYTLKHKNSSCFVFNINLV